MTMRVASRWRGCAARGGSQRRAGQLASFAGWRFATRENRTLSALQLTEVGATTDGSSRVVPGDEQAT